MYFQTTLSIRLGFVTCLALALTACGGDSSSTSNASPRPVPPQGKPALMVEMKDKQPLALAGSVFWDGTAKPASISYTGKSQFKPTLTLRFDHPNGFGLFADYGNGGTVLPVTLPEGCDDGGGDLKTGCYGQLGLVDFDKDGNPAVVVAFGDGNINLHVNVIRYHPPGSASDVVRSENWELIGSFEGQSQARIDDTKVELPIGSQGGSNQFVFVQSKFLDYNGSAAPQAPARAQPVRAPTTTTPSAPSTPTRTHYTVAGGAPLCSSFKGAITAEAVMRSGNPMAIDAVLSRQGCETSPQPIDIDPGASIQELQAGVTMINTPSGDRVYTTSDSISTTRH